MSRLLLYGFFYLCIVIHGVSLLSAQSFDTPMKIDGYRGIWFELGQVSEYGDKYSGGLGTYTAKHHPLAINSQEVNKTFFVYGGTTDSTERHLLAMISFYDHNDHVVPRPTVVHDKQTVDDPHDNPSMTIDESGHLWVFVSGRARTRPGFVYRSIRPYDIDAFELVLEDEFAYPQPWWQANNGCLLLFTRYTNGRELYWMNSQDGRSWSTPKKLVQGGHYQMSNQLDQLVITAFNVHMPATSVDTRTNLYFLQTDDFGTTWRSVDGTAVNTPLDELNNPALVRDYQSEGRLVYLKDIGFDEAGHPVLLYITSGNYKPGPEGAPRFWTTAHWTGERWLYSEITEAGHNYDMGSLYIEKDGTWRLIAPTDPGPQYWGTGGEIAIWASQDDGRSWKKGRQVTQNSVRNAGYVRRPMSAHPDFYAFWADGNPDKFSISHLYYTNMTGENVWILPYRMKGATAEPSLLE